MATLTCTKCGTENPPDNLFCEMCGASLKGIQPSEGDRTVMVARESPPPPPVVEEKPVAPPPAPKGTPEPVPVVPVAAVVPPPPPPPAAPAFIGTPINKLGVRQDSWSELVEGAAGKADQIAEAFMEEVELAEIPGVKVTPATLTSGTSEPRKYFLVHNGKGATVAVRFAAFGKDLYYTWELFTKRVINWLTIGILLGLAFLFTLIPTINTWVGMGNQFFYGLYTLVSLFLGSLLVPGLALLLFGKLFKDDIWGFYMKDLDDFALDDADALTTTVDDCITLAVEKVLEI